MSNILIKQKFILEGHKLSPRHLQRLPQVYWKMSIFLTGVGVMENVNLYIIII